MRRNGLHRQPLARDAAEAARSRSDRRQGISRRRAPASAAALEELQESEAIEVEEAGQILQKDLVAETGLYEIANAQELP